MHNTHRNDVKENAAMLLKLLVTATFMLLSSIPAAAEPPGINPTITEWHLPYPMFGRTVATGPDGFIFIAVPNDNMVVRFDPRTQSFRTWEMPRGHQPASLAVDRTGTVWTTGYGNGTIGRLKPVNGMIAEFSVPSGGGGPHTLVISDDGETLWFTMQTGDKLGSLDTATGRIVEYETSGNPSGITIDNVGNVWWCRSADNKLGRLEPRSGIISEIDLGRGTRPRRIAAATDGMLWVTLYGKGQLVKVSTQTMKVVKTYSLPGGNAGAQSVAVDASGIVWVNELKTDTVVRLDTATDAMQTIRLPSINNGIRHLAIDATARVWYVGSHNGKLGVID